MKKTILPLVLVSLLAVACQPTSPPVLAVFRSDGCSCFPDGTVAEPDLWGKDCRTHDAAYWRGGTFEERKAADQLLRDGLREKGKPVIALIAYTGVRLGGSPWLPTPWRWGFGWREFPRGYRELSEDERRVISETTAPSDLTAGDGENDER